MVAGKCAPVPPDQSRIPCGPAGDQNQAPPHSIRLATNHLNSGTTYLKRKAWHIWYCYSGKIYDLHEYVEDVTNILKIMFQKLVEKWLLGITT